MAKPSEPKPKPKDITKKKVVGSGRGIDKIDKGSWGPRKPKTGKTTRGKK